MKEPTPKQPSSCESIAHPSADWRAASSAHYALFGEARDELALPGEVWTITAANANAEDQLLLAVITASLEGDRAAIIPLASETLHATESDLTIPAAVLGYDAIAQVKLAGTVFAAQLDQRVSSLPAPLMGELMQLAHAAEEGASIPPADLPVGPWVLAEADPRLRTREVTAQSLLHYLKPAHQDPNSEWLSFGSILLRHSHAIGVHLDSLIEPDWAKKLARDELDLFERVPARKLAALLGKLQVKWNERIRDGLYRLVLERCNPTEVLQGTALGRRQGKRKRRAKRINAPLERRERAAEQYVAEVEKAMGEQ
jgi:hypothetical protein